MLALSTTLAACARTAAEAPPPQVVTVAAPEVKPPAELLRCARRPAGFPAAVLGTLTPEARAALQRVMTAFGANADQLDRLMAFHGGECGAAT
jgi:hypothetical protein